MNSFEFQAHPQSPRGKSGPISMKRRKKGKARESEKSASRGGPEAALALTPSAPRAASASTSPPTQPGGNVTSLPMSAAPREPIQSALTDWPPAAVRRRPSERAAVCKQLAGRVEPVAYLLARACPAAFFPGRPTDGRALRV